MIKNLPANKKRGFDPWVGKIPWRRARQPTPAFLPGESQGQRSLAGGSPRGHKESDLKQLKRLSIYAQRHRYKNISFYCSLLCFEYNALKKKKGKWKLWGKPALIRSVVPFFQQNWLISYHGITYW